MFPFPFKSASYAERFCFHLSLAAIGTLAVIGGIVKALLVQLIAGFSEINVLCTFSATLQKFQTKIH